MKVPFSPPDMSGKEIEYVSRVLGSGWITTGPSVKQFEQALFLYTGKKRTACLSSATAAMELSLRALGVGPGDEVITTVYTFSASAAVIVHVGATPVLVDTEKGSPFMSLDAFEGAITERTKAVIPVDIGGVPVDYDGLKRIIEAKRGLFKPSGDVQTGLGRIAIVADCAHSLGSLYDGDSVAKASDFACFSFHAVKNLTTAEGGAVSFDDVGGVSADELYERFMLLSLHGQSKDALAKAKLGAWEYDIVIPGYKCNMTDMMAAVGLAQLERYDALLLRRREIADMYERLLEDTPITLLGHDFDKRTGNRHLCIVTAADIDERTRNEIIVDMAKDGVSANVHYKPLPMLTAYKALGFDIKDFPNAYDYYRREITLPLHTLLTDEQVEYCAASLLKSAAKRC